MDFKKQFNQLKSLVIKLWRTEDSKISIIRDVLVALILVLIILTALWGYTGQWFSAPMVAIESGSMMHLDEPFGRLGTIDAGDMVLLVKVNELKDVVTFSEKNDDVHTYGKYGDVIIYRPDGETNTDQIIHRAMTWVEVDYVGDVKTYTIREYDIINQPANESLFIPEIGLTSPNYPYNDPVHVNWSYSGYITKGDNPISNPTCDQIGGICSQPVRFEWVSGKARSELPWIGTINLLFNDIVGGKNTVGNVPQDSIICLVIVIIILISIPVSLDIYAHIKEQNEKNKELLSKKDNVNPRDNDNKY